MNPLITCMGKRILTYARRLTQPLIGVILLSAGCATAPVDTIPAGRIVLGIVTWNMDAGRGDLPRLITDLEAGRLTPGAPENVVLLLQEAVHDDAPTLPALAHARKWHFVFEPVRVNGPRATGNAILASQPLHDRRSITLPRERQPRGAVAASVDVAGERLFLVSAHLENRVSLWRALFSDVARRRQADALIDALPADGFGVLGGDFNAWLGRNEPAWRVLLDRFDDTPGVMRTATFRNRLVLDHLLFDLPSGWRVVTTVSRDAYGSDHHPVVAALSVSSHGPAR